MHPKKAPLSQLFKNGENFQFSKINYSSKKITKEIQALKKEQEVIRKSGEVDINELRKFIINI